MKKQNKNNELVPPEEQPYEIPEGWKWVRLGEAGVVIQRGTSITKKQTEMGNIPVIAGGQEPSYFHNIANRNGNTITVSSSGAYAGFVNYFEIPIFASDCSTIQSQDENKISIKLVYLFLKSIQNKIYNKQRGMTQPHVYAKDLVDIPFPLPPLSEQERIVSCIESLFEKLNRVDEIIKNVFDKFPLRKATILHQAFTGELTAKWREEKNVSMDTWEEVKINDICVINPKRTDISNVDDSTEVSFVPMSSVSDISGEIIDYLNRPLKEVKKGYTSFEEGDIVFAKITPCMENGKTAIVGKLKNGVGFGSTEFHVLRCKSNLDKKFLYYILRNQKFRDEAKYNMTGSVGQQRVPKSFIENYLLHLPSLAEQKEIVRRLESLFEKEEHAKELCNQTEKIELMKKAILARAFRGLLF